jgi:hypothetical protein
MVGAIVSPVASLVPSSRITEGDASRKTSFATSK